MQDFECIEDAMRVAKQALSGEIDLNLACGLIAGISRKLNHPRELDMFMLLNHEQSGHEGLDINAESCISDIQSACRQLLAMQD